MCLAKDGLCSLTQTSSPYMMAIQTSDLNNKGTSQKMSLHGDTDYDTNRALTPILNQSNSPTFQRTPGGPTSNNLPRAQPDIQE